MVAPAPEREITDVDARIVAFYLPQYHTIPENDQWWGEGFTDWTNVRKAKPQFPGHGQPRVPTTLGYYDLRNVETHHAQAALARAHGVAAFCYYAYWFGGRRLLEAPLEVVASNPDLAMPYALCWANEPWSRRWDGNDRDVLIEQRHSPTGDAAFIDDIAVHLADPRYLRVEGRPVLLIYRAGLLAEPRRTVDNLRDRTTKLGLGNLFLTMVQSFADRDPSTFGFDAAVEFPPHAIWPRRTIPRSEVTPGDGFTGELVRYDDLVAVALSRPEPSFPWFRGVAPGWDNTPRRGSRASVFSGSTPAKFEDWLRGALTSTYLYQRPSRRLVFVNAWNEWAEGAFLEPDVEHRDAYLRAVSSALHSTHDLARATARAWEADIPSDRLDDLRSQWRAQHPVRSERDFGRSQLSRFPVLYQAAGRLARTVRRVHARIR